jgi:hypothetical protein
VCIVAGGVEVVVAGGGRFAGGEAWAAGSMLAGGEER